MMVAGKEELMVGAVLVHVMEVATMNSHEIGQLQVSDSCRSALSWSAFYRYSLYGGGQEHLRDRPPLGSSCW
jgi:hypothetical protein